jgi:lysozyme
MADPVTVIDVSHYQAGLDLSPFAAAGGLAVIAKASQGLSTADPNYAGFRAQALALKLGFASYHYLTSDDPAAQAAFYLATATPVQGERVIADWEAVGVNAALVQAFFEAIVSARPDLELTVYSGQSAKAELGTTRNVWLAQMTSLWLAQYTSGSPSWPAATWPQWSLWQYADSGTVAGYAGAIDVSKFNGSNANLLKWIGPAAPAAPAPPAGSGEVSTTLAISITSSAPVNVTVNGVTIAVPASSA